MKNYNIRNNNIFINIDNLIRKKSYENKIDKKRIFDKLTLNKLNKITYSTIPKTLSSIALTNRPFNRNKKISFFPIFNEHYTIQTNKHNLKLNPILHKKLFQNERLNNVTYELFNNKDKYINTKSFINTNNYSLPSDFYFDEDDQDTKIMKKHYLKINNLLNRKMIIKPKLRKITFKFNKEKSKTINTIKNVLKSSYKELTQIEDNPKLKPVRYYFTSVKNNYINKTNKKHNIISKSLTSKIKSNSFILSKNNSLEDNDVYQIIESKDKKNKVIYANKLIINDNNNKDNKENDLYRKKISDNMVSDFIKIYGSNYRNFQRKMKFTSLGLKNKNAKTIHYIPDHEIKLLSKKGFERMIDRKIKDFSNIIKNAMSEIEANKANFKDIMEINGQIYLKNKQYALNDDNL